MNVVMAEKDVFEGFEPVKDAFFFRTGSHGLVSFYGRNYTKKKRMSVEELNSLVTHPSFVRVSLQCYVNTSKIAATENHLIYFRDKISYPLTLSVSRRQEQKVKKLLAN
ncbi:hypothetical protein DCC85_08305 [Paenibacillus sp. CAA11]|uniref:LytTR family transcriptional regulator DNA-binding domain-containing protein n=1 Tax=Paenibacillus sp. CAA11 TaxID=1532905 RepID=UPI000D348951|nr:LytTR family transcriptional regulator DNA-binding domain-containing protein [Paenibacillus sp. CAA11]AWB44214.1 hypothetical protein DCC85_08305 [Paenibacillus sp. CAA11]